MEPTCLSYGGALVKIDTQEKQTYISHALGEYEIRKKTSLSILLLKPRESLRDFPELKTDRGHILRYIAHSAKNTTIVMQMPIHNHERK